MFRGPPESSTFEGDLYVHAKRPGQKPSATRNVSRLNQKLDRKLTAYMAAAGAAGVSMLALAQPAEAKVVYTNANLNIGNVAIDLNNDGINDFRFFLERYSTNPRLSFLLCYCTGW